MNYGEWMAILEFLEEHNDSGKREICRCSQCDGTYVHDRAYVNSDGDFVISRDTLSSLLDEFKYSDSFSFNHQTKEFGRYFAKYWDAAQGPNAKAGIQEEDRIMKSLVKKEYE